MGSGKGQQRRVQAGANVPVAREVVTYDEGKWSEFVRGGRMQRVGVREYYLGKDLSFKSDDQEQDELISELFADAVEVGMITLPSRAKVEDFQLKIEHGVVIVRFKGKPTNKDGPGYYLDPTTTMNHTDLRWTLRKISETLANFFIN